MENNWTSFDRLARERFDTMPNKECYLLMGYKVESDGFVLVLGYPGTHKPQPLINYTGVNI